MPVSLIVDYLVKRLLKTPGMNPCEHWDVVRRYEKPIKDGICMELEYNDGEGGYYRYAHIEVYPNHIRFVSADIEKLYKPDATNAVTLVLEDIVSILEKDECF